MQQFRRIANERAISVIGVRLAKLQQDKQMVTNNLQSVSAQLQDLSNVIMRFTTVSIGVNTPVFRELYEKVRNAFDELAGKIATTLVGVKIAEEIVLGAYAELFRSYRESIGKKVRWPKR